MTIHDCAFIAPDLYSRCFDRKMLGRLCLRIMQVYVRERRIEWAIFIWRGTLRNRIEKMYSRLTSTFVFHFSRCDFYSLPPSSSYSLTSSSFDASFVGHPITKPSLSDSDGLGMTWKWTWSTTLVCNRVSVRALGEEESTWWAIRPLFCKIL